MTSISRDCVVLVVAACATVVLRPSAAVAQAGAAPSSRPVQSKEELVAEARRLNLMVQELARQGRYKDAIVAARRGLELTESIRGPVHRDVSSDLITLAALYRHERDYFNAEPMIMRAIEIDKKLFGARNAEVGVDLCALGILYARKGQSQLALAKFAEGLGMMAGRKQAKTHIYGRAVCLLEQGQTFLSVSQYDAGIAALTTSAQLFEAADPLQAADVHQQVAEAARARGDQKLASTSLARAQQMRSGAR